jgi:hypothetical protein
MSFIPTSCLQAGTPPQVINRDISILEETQTDMPVSAFVCAPAALHARLGGFADVDLDAGSDFHDFKLTSGAEKKLRAAQARGGRWRVVVRGLREDAACASGNLLHALLERQVTILQDPLPMRLATVVVLHTAPASELKAQWEVDPDARKCITPTSLFARFQLRDSSCLEASALAACPTVAAAVPRGGVSQGGFQDGAPLLLLLLVAALAAMFLGSGSDVAAPPPLKGGAARKCGGAPLAGGAEESAVAGSEAPATAAAAASTKTMGGKGLSARSRSTKRSSPNSDGARK